MLQDSEKRNQYDVCNRRQNQHTNINSKLKELFRHRVQCPTKKSEWPTDSLNLRGVYVGLVEPIISGHKDT